MPLKIVRNDITRMDTEAIVNTASPEVTIGAGCDSAVYKAAGEEELLSYRREHIGRVPEGEVFLTPGFGLRAKYIIHAVSPFYRDGTRGEEEKLRSCYWKSLALAKENGLRSIAFPLIATGSFGYPKEEGMRIAVDEIAAFLLENTMEIFLVVFDTRSTFLGAKITPDLETYIDHNYVKEKREEEYGELESVGSGTSRRRERNLAAKNLPRPFTGATAASMAPVMAEPLCKKESAAENLSLREDLLEDEASLDFEEQHESRLEERMQHLSDTFSQYLLYLIREKKMENAEVWKRAIVDKKVFSKLKSHPDYHPQKLTALCLCVGAKLNLDETKDLLARAGYALSPCDKTDIIFSYFIENGIYDMIELDIQLEEHGLPCIIE